MVALLLVPALVAARVAPISLIPLSLGLTRKHLPAIGKPSIAWEVAREVWRGSRFSRRSVTPVTVTMMTLTVWFPKVPSTRLAASKEVRT